MKREEIQALARNPWQLSEQGSNQEGASTSSSSDSSQDWHGVENLGCWDPKQLEVWSRTSSDGSLFDTSFQILFCKLVNRLNQIRSLIDVSLRPRHPFLDINLHQAAMFLGMRTAQMLAWQSSADCCVCSAPLGNVAQRSMAEACTASSFDMLQPMFLSRKYVTPKLQTIGLCLSKSMKVFEPHSASLCQSVIIHFNLL